MTVSVGRGAVTAMTDMESFRLFPAVFTIPKKVEAEVGTSYGKEGIELMEAADQLLDDWRPQVIDLLSRDKSGKDLATESKHCVLIL